MIAVDGCGHTSLGEAAQMVAFAVVVAGVIVLVLSILDSRLRRRGR